MRNGMVEAVIHIAKMMELKISKYMGTLIGLLGLTNLEGRHRTLSCTKPQ